MTLYGWGNPRYFPRLPAPTVRYFDIAPDARVLAHCHWQPEPWKHPTIVALHGLNGSSDAHYMRGIADKAFARGHERRPPQPAQLRRHRTSVGRPVSLRADGTTPSTSSTSCRDVDGLRAIAVAGYSLGGNLALKLAGEYGDHPHPVAARRRCAFRRSSRSASASARSNARATSSTSGISSAT